MHAKTPFAVALDVEALTIVSHDLRSPLSAILSGAELLTTTEPPESSAHQIGLRLLSSAERARRLIDNLLRYSQARAGHGISVHKENCDAHAIAVEVIDEHRMIRTEPTVEFSCSGDGVLEADPLHVEQILSNLVTNAVAHGAVGKPIRVSVRGQKEDVALEVHNHNAQGAIPEHLRPTIYLPFKRGTSSGSGIGLGLYIVNQLVHAHGGSIDLRSTDEEGTTFTATLPKHRVPDFTNSLFPLGAES